ncbi:MAG: hypothetical protein JW974_02745 [Alphaproteobacteria bacterium]|nr:hypothetical protein [Alphaproteobacteria bacterium]MBN2675570.1 hypothetical protein [Alphaproteobacteria bacterium]
MNLNEFLSYMKSNGAVIAPGVADNLIKLASSGLQNIRAATLPTFIIDFYKVSGGCILGNAYIFGPSEITITKGFPIPSILQINREIANITQMRGKTIFGRNDLFWFAFDAFGNCFMLDNISLKTMRQYDDPWRAMTDCLIVGKI